MSITIKFGTSGWRGLIARDFTFDNVRVATQAIAEYLCQVKSPPSKEVIIGYDTRFLGQEFLAWLWYKSEERGGSVEVPGRAAPFAHCLLGRGHRGDGLYPLSAVSIA